MTQRFNHLSRRHFVASLAAAPLAFAAPEAGAEPIIDIHQHTHYSGRSDEDLIRRIADIDLEDGKLDGRKAATPPRPCPHCQRVLSKNRPRCLFCGKPVEMLPFER